MIILKNQYGKNSFPPRDISYLINTGSLVILKDISMIREITHNGRRCYNLPHYPYVSEVETLIKGNNLKYLINNKEVYLIKKTARRRVEYGVGNSYHITNPVTGYTMILPDCIIDSVNYRRSLHSHYNNLRYSVNWNDLDDTFKALIPPNIVDNKDQETVPFDTEEIRLETYEDYQTYVKTRTGERRSVAYEDN